MCLRSPWSSMGVTSTKVPVRGGRTGSGRRCFWQSLREILSLCQFPSWSLTNPLPLLLRAVLSVLPLPLPSWHKQRRCWNTWKVFDISGTTWHRRLVRLKRSGRRCASRCRTWGQLSEVSCTWSISQGSWDVNGCFSWAKCTQREKEKETKKTPWPALTRRAQVL